MSNYAESLCYPEQLPPVIIHQIRLEDKNVDPTTEDIWNYYSQNHGAD